MGTLGGALYIDLAATSAKTTQNQSLTLIVWKSY